MNQPKAETHSSPATPGRWPNSGILWFALKTLIALGMLYALYRWGFLSWSGLRLTERSPMLLTFSALLIFATIPLAAWRWKILLSCQGLAIGYQKIFSLFYASHFFSLFLPGGVGGDAVRVLYVCRVFPKRRTASVLSVLMDRLLGFHGLASLAFIGVVLNQGTILGSPALKLLAAMVSAVFAGGFALAACLPLVSRYRRLFHAWAERRGGRVTGLLDRLLEALAIYHGHAPQIALGWFISILIHTSAIAGLLILALSMNFGRENLGQFSLAAPVALLANILPLTPGGLGVGEAVFSQVSAMLAPALAALPYASLLLAHRVFSTLVALPGLLCYIGQRKFAGETPRENQCGMPGGSS